VDVLGLVGLTITLATALAVGPVAAAGASLRIEPATVAVASGATFAVTIVQESAMATSGAQASIRFDPAIVQIVTVEPGTAYASAPIFLPVDIAGDIRTANATGYLAQVAAAHTPPAAVPPGSASFMVVRFRVVDCGSTELALPAGGPFDAQMISGGADAYGHELAVATAGGRVTTCVGPAAVSVDARSPAPGPTGGPNPLRFVGLAGLVGIGLLGALVVRSWRTRSLASGVAEKAHATKPDTDLTNCPFSDCDVTSARERAQRSETEVNRRHLSSPHGR